MKKISDYVKYKFFVSQIYLNHSIIMETEKLLPSDVSHFCYLFDEAKKFDNKNGNNELKSILLNDLAIALRRDTNNYFRRSNILEHIRTNNKEESKEDLKYRVKLNYFLKELDNTEYLSMIKEEQKKLVK